MSTGFDSLRRAVKAAAAEHPITAILAAVWQGLAGERDLPRELDPNWPSEHGRRLDAVRAAAEGAPPEAFGIAYESLLALDPERRGRQGSHFTPPELASEVVAETLRFLPPAVPDAPVRVCDPALGGGVFLLQASSFLTTHGVSHQLYGVDKDPLAVTVARLSLWLATGDAKAASRLVVGDALLGPVRVGEWPAEGDAVTWHELDGFADGFDAVVGNPPFLGGSFISGRLGPEYRAELVARVAGGRRGNADLTAYFLLRAYDLLRDGGRLGLVVTNTIAEGDTRKVGLAHLLERGAAVIRAERDRRWPGDASLHYTLLWMRKGGEAGPATLDGRSVPQIDAMLRSGERHEPRRLAANAGLAFNGSKIYGQGFLLAAAEAEAILADEPQSAEVIRPYLSGNDLYGRPDRSASRLVICFRDWPLERAEEHRRCLEIVRERVKPERDQLAGRNSIGDRRAACWWQFGSYAPALYTAIAGREQVLAKVLHSHTHAFCPTPADAVYSHALTIFADPDPALLAILQSSVHRAWALRQGSTLGIAPRYTISRTFETFPLPPRTACLRELGEALERHRGEVQQRRGEGLTTLTQRLADRSETGTDLVGWRALEEAIDAAVLAAYGWTDLDAAHVRGGEPAPKTVEAIVDRLWELNLTSTGVRR